MHKSNNIGAEFLAQFEAEPDAVIFINRAGHLTRREFGDQIDALKQAFIEDGVEPGQVVGLANTDQVATFTAIFALWALGASSLVLDFRSTANELAHNLARMGGAHLFSDYRRLNRSDEIAVFPPFPSKGGNADKLVFDVDPESIADFGSSSGVGGPPKYKPVTHEKLVRSIRDMAVNGKRGSWGNMVSCLSISFSGTRYAWFRNVVFGKKIITVPVLFSYGELDAALLNENAEEAMLPPILITGLVNHLKETGQAGERPRYKSLVKLQSIGGPLVGAPLIEAKAILSDRLAVTYSSTQTDVVSRLAGDAINSHPNSVGIPFAECQVRILAEDGSALPNCQVGDIEVMHKGKSVLPGDRGYLDDDGYLYVTGRVQDFFCRNGVNFNAGDLEDRISAVLGGAQCCVIGIQRSSGDDDEIVAIIETEPNRLKDIKERLRLQLSATTKPNKVALIEKLPRTSGMKIARDRLRRLIETDPEICDVL